MHVFALDFHIIIALKELLLHTDPSLLFHPFLLFPYSIPLFSFTTHPARALVEGPLNTLVAVAALIASILVIVMMMIM